MGFGSELPALTDEREQPCPEKCMCFEVLGVVVKTREGGRIAASLDKYVI